MKLTIFAVIVCVCLVAVNANSGAYVQPEPSDVDLDLDFDYQPEDYADGIVDIELFGFKKVIKSALRSLKGVNCSIKAALIMKAAAEQGLDDINACGVQVTKQVQSVINQLNKIINIVNDLVHLNQNVCKTEPEEGNTSSSCFKKFVRKIGSLYKNIQKTINMIKKVPDSGKNASACVTTALTKVSDTFMQFVPFVTDCSNLTGY